MRPLEGNFKTKTKKFVVNFFLEPLVPLRRLESYFIFWAHLVYRIRKPFIIGITGSVGKSTTTAMVAAVLSHPDAERIVGPVGCTFSNMNDNVGLAATLLRFEHVFEIPWSYPGRVALLLSLPLRALRLLIGRYPKVMVLECGAGSTANLHRLVTIAPPDIAVVTRIGAAHLELMKTLDGVVQEKSALVRAVSPSGLVILGQGHDYVSQFEQVARAPVVKVDGQGVELSQNIARAVCRHMSVPDAVVSSGLKDFKNPEGRLNRLELAGMLVIDDTYNANPLSMKLGLDTLASTAGQGQRRLAILGSMSEMGEESRRYHEELGDYARSRADLLIGVGELSRHYAPDHWFDSSDACANEIEKLLRCDDCVLVKGSASARMSRVVTKLREIAEQRQQSVPLLV